MQRYILALDQGTTSSRAILFGRDGSVAGYAQQTFRQHYPQPGWVEHDPNEIWESERAVAAQALRKAGLGREIAAIGITNQRETTILWDRATGEPIYNAIVWQCRRTAELCEQIKADGMEEYIKDKTGLVIDAYFSGTKIKWILDNVPGARALAEADQLLFGTVETWLIWNLTGGRVHITDYSNASRTMLFDVDNLCWDEKMCEYLNIPMSILPEVKPSSMVYGKGAGELPTASACVADVIECLQEERHRPEIGWSADTGGFASLGGPVLERACTHAAGPYHYENFEIEGHAYYTNNPPAGAFRGFGVTQTCFATETLLNEMADLVGISPWEIRYRNAIRPGEVLPNGQIVGPETGLVETLEAIKPYYDEAVKNGEPVGLACAMKNAGVGVGLPDYGRCKLVIDEEGKVHIRTGASCIGQGLGTVLVQIVVTNAGLRREDVVYDGNSTFITPDSGDTSGSRQTLITGEACRRACLLLRDAMENRSLSDLAGQEFYGEYYAKTNPLGADVPNPVSHVAYGYATQMCIVDKETGLIKKMVAAHDVGKAINPLSCEGQIEGGVVMSMGYALTEKFPLDHGKPTAKYGMLGLFRANQIPEIKALVIDKPGLNLANGAIGIGEITSIPTAPAIADAYFRYDGERRRSLPLDHTPYKK